MKVFKNHSTIIRYLLFIYFLIPYLIFFKFYNLNFNLDYSEIFWAFKNSFVQASVAALVVLILSVPLSFGLFSLNAKLRMIFKNLLLIPQVLPSLFSILIAFSLWPNFPMGTVGIVFIFCLVNLGFGITYIAAATEEKIGSFALTGEVYNLGRIQFLSKVYLPLLKYDFLTLFALIFVFCFSSFAIPLMAGGGKGTNLEVLIFEKIFIEQNWPAAWTINLFQAGLIFAISGLVLKDKGFNRSQFVDGQYLKSKTSFVFILIYLFTYLFGYVEGLLDAFIKNSFVQALSEDVLVSTMVTLHMLLIYLVVCFLILAIWLYDFVKNGRHNRARNLLSVSTVLIGFAFYLQFPLTKFGDYLKASLAMTILFIPALIKLFLEKPLNQLAGQIQVAKVFGLSDIVIIKDVILRQIKKPLYTWTGFLIIWFICDFAVMRALGVQQQTLGMMAQGYLSSYRMSLSYLISFYILVLWFTIMLAIYLISEAISVINKRPSA